MQKAKQTAKKPEIKSAGNGLENTLNEYATSEVDSTDALDRQNAADHTYKEWSQQFTGDVEKWSDASHEAEQAIVRPAADLLLKFYDSAYTPEKFGDHLPVNYKDDSKENQKLIEEVSKRWDQMVPVAKALHADPGAKEQIAIWREALRDGKKIDLKTKLLNGRGKPIYLIAGRYKTMKSSMKRAIERGDTNLTKFSKTDLFYGFGKKAPKAKPAAKASSVVTADTLNAAKAKLDAQADANGFVFNPATGKYEAIVATAA